MSVISLYPQTPADQVVSGLGLLSYNANEPVAANKVQLVDVTKIRWLHRGTWSGATAYSVNDVVLLTGATYLCILAHTNHTPPNATYWVVLGGTGDLSNLNANNLTSGTMPDARFPATLPAASGVNLTALSATALASGTVDPARLGSGSGITTKFLRGDSTWQSISGGGDALVASPLSQFAATTSAQLAGVISDETGTGALVFAGSPTFTGTVTVATIAATTITGAGSGITALNASNLASGTVPDARFPATLPALSGVNLTALNASNLGSGTVPDARFPATLPALSGVNLTALNASNLSSGTIPAARLPRLTFNTQTGDYTAVAADAVGTKIVMNKATGQALTWPPTAGVYSTGDLIPWEQIGVGAVTHTPGAGVSLLRPARTSLVCSQFASGYAEVVTTDTYRLLGALTDTTDVEQTCAINGSTGDLPIDYNAGGWVKTTVGHNLTTVTVTNAPTNGVAVIKVKLVANGTGYTQAWSVNGVTAKWDGGSAPTLPTTTSHTMGIALLSDDGFVADVRAVLIWQEMSA